jgi:hypothetical protein
MLQNSKPRYLSAFYNWNTIKSQNVHKDPAQHGLPSTTVSYFLEPLLVFKIWFNSRLTTGLNSFQAHDPDRRSCKSERATLTAQPRESCTHTARKTRQAMEVNMGILEFQNLCKTISARAPGLP